MKKGMIAVAIALCLVLSMTAQVKTGPVVDKVIYEVRMDQTIATKDVVEGKSDMFLQEVPAPVFRQLSDADKAKLEIYTVPSLTYSLLMNPFPNKAPYVATVEGKDFFNPFAIREIRFAMNFLVDRKKIVDEIMLGDGQVMYTMGTPGQPGTYKYNLISAQLGFKPRGDEAKAIADIGAAMKKASELPENKGKLVKTGQFWTFNGQPVTVKILIRVDDPNMRLLEGRYIADQIEKAGIKTERLEYDRSKCSKIYNGNPAAYEWSMYTEAWGAGATRAWWAHIVAQMYAPYYGNTPGGGSDQKWNYEMSEIDELLQPAVDNNFLTEEEYWDRVLKATKIGLTEGIRVYIAAANGRFATSKTNLLGRVPYGLGDGLNEWSIRAADKKPETSGPNKGLKVLKVTQFSAQGSLFMYAWDPVGGDGFSDSYAQAIMRVCTDTSTFEAPNTALTTPLLGVLDMKTLVTKPVKNADGTLGGAIEVPASAVVYDTKTKTWKEVGPGVKATTSGTAGYKYGKWHDMADVTFADMVYGTAFTYEWTFKDGDNDKYYDEAFASQYTELLPLTKGIVWNKKDKTATGYAIGHFPMEPARSFPTISPQAGNPGYNAVVPWQIYEALAQLVAEGSKSGTPYTFTAGIESLTEVDVKDVPCVADIKAKLEELAAKKFVPVSIKDFITADEAVARYNGSIAFIEKYGHAYISNGPFYISKIDTVANYVETTAFRDGYPIAADYWPKYFAMKLSSIDNVKVPAGAVRTKDVTVDITVSSYEYPNSAKTPLDAGKVTASLQLPDGGEKVYVAKKSKDGLFQATIPAADMKALKAGNYTLVVQSQVSTEAPAVSPATIVLF